MKRKQMSDILICGCGIIGLTLARELADRGCTKITIIEKEDDIGKHASGRNSGVLHAGIYYTPDSFKAKTCLAGNRLMKKYCMEKGLPLVESGKVIVTKNEAEIPALLELYTRAKSNGAGVELLDEKSLKEIEPYALTVSKALYSPETAIIDPKEILKSLYEDCIRSKKVIIHKNTEFKNLSGSNAISTTRGGFSFKTFINSAGVFSDRIAHAFGLAGDYRLIPFRGTYKKLNPGRSSLVRGSIYPVPELKNPFLGVHFTRGITGDVYIGPTAMPALGRENYRITEGLNMESLGIAFMDMVLFFTNRGFRTVALSEPKKYLKRCLYNDAKKLINGLKMDDIVPAAKTGIRPQLVDWKKKELVMDFTVIKDSNSIHILNAISPAFTSSMELAKIIVDKYL